MKQITVLCGRVGAGKTKALLDRLSQRARAGSPVLLLVPEPYTYDAELLLLGAVGKTALNAEALGFSRLTERVLAEAGGSSALFLSAEGRRMALRSVLDEDKEELTLYGQSSARSGFLDQAGALIDVFKSADLAPDALLRAASDVPDSLLARKLHDLAVLYGGLTERMAGRYADSADRLRLLCERMEESMSLRNTAVFVHSPHAFLFDARFYAVTERLLHCCDSVTMTLRLDEENDPLFAAERRALERLSSFAQLKLVYVHEKSDRPAALRTVEEQLFSTKKALPCFVDAGVTLVRASNPTAEAEAAAEEIFRLLHDGVTPGEIYIAASDTALYAPLLRAALERRGIPLFLDSRRPLSAHPAVDFLLSSLLAATRRFARSDVLRAAKSGLCALSGEEADLLEDYCLRFGIDHGAFLEPFSRGADRRPKLLAAAESARQALVPPLAALADALRQCKTASDCCRALYDYMLSCSLWERLEERADALEQNNRTDLAMETRQVYRAILDLLDQIAELMDGPMTADRFVRVLDEGFAARTVGVLPPTAHCLSFGDVQTASGRRIGRLLVLGANDGLFPPPVQDDGVLNDRDAALLRPLGIDLFPDRESRALHERHLCYALLSRPQTSLYVSCAAADAEGRETAPSPLFDRLCALFPNAVKAPNPGGFDHPTDAEEGFFELTAALRAYVDSAGKVCPPNLDAAYAYYAASDAYAPRLKFAESRLFGNPGMSPDDARGLYGAFRGSTVTRLEQFSRCPFAFLVSQGLRPDPRKEFSEQSSDAGTFYHDAFCAFFRAAQERYGDVRALSDGDAVALLDDITHRLAHTHNSGYLSDGAQNVRTLELMRRTARRTMLAMLEQYRAGDFEPLFCEAALGEELPALTLTLSDGRTATLYGRIDRVDICNTTGVPYLRIVDYKTGDKTFSYDELLSGLQLQLPLYLSACESLGRPTGMFYLHIDNPVADANDGMTEAKRFRLRGVVLDDVDALHAMDHKGEGFSDFLPVRFTKTGASGTAKGALLNDERLRLLTDSAKETAASVVERILSGESTPAPAQKGPWTACDWCDYRAICRFEPARGDVYRLVGEIDIEQFFQSREGAPDNP